MTHNFFPYALRQFVPGLGPMFYGPIYGADHGDWRLELFDAQGFSNKRDAIALAKHFAKRSQPDAVYTVVRLGDFGGVPNRIIDDVFTVYGTRTLVTR